MNHEKLLNEYFEELKCKCSCGKEHVITRYGLLWNGIYKLKWIVDYKYASVSSTDDRYCKEVDYNLVFDKSEYYKIYYCKKCGHSGPKEDFTCKDRLH